MSLAKHIKNHLGMGLVGAPSLRHGNAIAPELVRDYGPDFGHDLPGVISMFTDGNWSNGGVVDPEIVWSSATPDSTPYSAGGCSFVSSQSAVAKEHRKIFTFTTPLDLTQIRDNDGFLGLHVYIGEADFGSASQGLGAVYLAFSDGVNPLTNVNIMSGNCTPGYCFIGGPASTWTGTFNWDNVVSVQIMVNQAARPDYAPIDIDVHAVVGGMQLKTIFCWTFDDSFLGQYANGWRLWNGSSKYAVNKGVPVMVSCIAAQMDSGLNLTWEHARQMQAGGVDFAVHGGTEFHTLSRAALLADIQNTVSRMTAEGITERNATKHLFYPGGKMNGNSIDVMQELGFLTGRSIQGLSRAGVVPNDYWPTYQIQEAPGVSSKFTCIQHTAPHPYFLNSPAWGSATYPDAASMLASIDVCTAAGGGLYTPYIHGLAPGGGTDALDPTHMNTVTDGLATRMASGDVIGLSIDAAYHKLWGYAPWKQTE